MASTLFLGLGGTGSRVIAKLAKELENNHIAINDGAVCCAALDTHGNDFEYILKTMGVEANIPTVSTDGPQMVGDLLRKYPSAQDWFVDDLPVLNMEPMYTASSVRMKTRLAFMDAYHSGKMQPIEELIEKMQKRVGGDMSVVLISSVENGMLLQTALWLRNKFKEKGKEIHLCGILLLPDVFAKTIKLMSEDGEMEKRLYANAYAAIREINAISKVKKNPDEKTARIRIDDLFDTKDMKNPLRSQKDVFDSTFLLDYEAADGSNLKSIAEYEDQAARFAYMRICSPIQNIEDNHYLTILAQKGFSFGSFGVAKAVYPKKEVEEYCVLRAVSDVIGGWLAPKREIEAILKWEKEKEKAGEIVLNPIDPVEKYTALFEEHMRARGISAEKTPFFASLKEDTLKNKAKIFLQDLEKRISLAIEENNGAEKGFSRMNALGIDLENTGMQTYHFVDFAKELLDKYSVGILKEIVENNAYIFEKEKAIFEKNTLSELTDLTVNEVFPQTVNALDARNESSVYGMLTIPNEEMETRSFVHPVTVRYLLYKLRAEIAEALRTAQTEKENVRQRLEHLEDEVYFDYGRTKRRIETMYNYFEEPPHFWEGSADAHKQHFIKKYREYIQKQYAYGKEYETKTVYAEALCEIGQRTEQLIEKLEAFFAKLPALISICEAKIAENSETPNDSAANIAVCAGKKAKERIYHSLDVKFDGSDKSISKLVIDGVFGMFCAQAIPEYPENAKYADFDILNVFSNGIYDFYAQKMEQTYAENLDLDIFTALEIEAQSEGETDCMEKMKRLTETLKSRAVPYLRYTENEACSEYTVWGFHPSLVETCPSVSACMEANVETMANESYPKNELFCCTALYHLGTQDFPKLKEKANGEYYSAYRSVAASIDISKSYTLIRTPYLDKTWHEILPHLSEKED